MCTWQAGAMLVSSYLQMSDQRRRANEQAVAQDRQLKHEQEQAEMNAKLQAKKSEQLAEAYARKQKEINERMKLTQGANAASAGASGVSSTTGSAWDLAEASEEQYRQASKDLLQNQRNDIFGMNLEEYNLRKSAENIQNIRDLQRKQYRRNMRWENFSSMLSTAASIKGYRARHKVMEPATSGDSIYNPFMDNRSIKGVYNTGRDYSVWSERLPSLANPLSVTTSKGSLQGFNRQFGYPSPNGSFGMDGIYGYKGLKGKRVKL